MSHHHPPVVSSPSIIVGVDTHKEIHVAVAVTALGLRIADRSVSADRVGYTELVAWARALGPIGAFGIEGTGSYGAGLASPVRRQALRVIEVSHCDRRKRRPQGKSDTLDAELAARSGLAGTATAIPKTADGAAEMVRQIKIARDTAVKARRAAIVTLKTLLVNAPSERRERLQPLTDRQLLDRCARCRPGPLVDTTASIQHACRALAARGRTLSAEIGTHDEALDTLTRAAVPSVREAFGIGPDSAAEMMIVAGDNPTRVRSDSAFAKLCGACPIVTARMRWHQPTLDYVARRTAQGLGKRDILRGVKRFVAREVYNALLVDHRASLAKQRPAVLIADES